MKPPAMSLTLIQFPRAMGVMNASPFCMKVELFLRLGGLAYTVDDRTPPFKAPKRKLPALRDGGGDGGDGGGTLVADSEAIVAHLQRRYAAQLPPALAAAETGAQLALRRLLEEDLYFAMLWLRWIDDTGFALTSKAFFSSLPGPLGPWVAALVRRKMRRDLVGQGMGRHTPGQIAARACADLAAVAAVLGEQAFFAGAAPGAIDCCAYAFLAGILFVPLDTPVKRQLMLTPTLVAYCARMEALAGR